MKDRIKALRKALSLNQTDFGSKIGVKQSAVAAYESGSRNPLDSVIVSICREFGVNERWLRTGEGEMLMHLSREEEIMRFAATVIRDPSSEFQRQALAVLEQDGLIEKRRGSGSFLCPAAARQDRRIAVIATSLSDYIFPSLLKDVQACLSAQGFSVVIHATENSIRRERDILQQLLLDPPAGILVESCKTALPNPNAELYQALRQRGLPMTFLHGSCREITDAFCVGDDNYGGGYLLAGHLIRNGHQKIAGIFKSDDVQGPERYHGVVCAMRDAGLFPLDENFLWFSSFQRHQLVELQDEELLRAFLRQQLGGCTAVVCYNDEIAFHLIRTLLRAGKRVPGDVAIVSFDNSYYSTFGPVSITSAGHEPHAMGRAAAENLLTQIRRQPCQSVKLPWTLYQRQSG